MSNNSGLARVLAVAEGGTGGSSASIAKVNLGIEGLSTSSGTFALELESTDFTTFHTVTYPDSDGQAGLVVFKFTTGDPVVPEGIIVINTVDNNVKIMADGALRQIATW